MHQPGSVTPGPPVHWLGPTGTHLAAREQLGEYSLVVCPGRREKEELNGQFQPQVLDRLVFQQSFR